ncbi:MAG: polysaccharide deacetylase family protein [Phenylobacterium sp.]|uniref:polysaccharide deacetylase family protein n=1 Tax=Phenylobacterium sp. TaxID=1871053 RepID=UPI0027336214|nr:polysaccharide deacetylase family protein [Phenylobacterium sp.]MDP3173370.1 polysaccharide deacetylase family protein [Phenylobacterium sp.]
MKPPRIEAWPNGGKIAVIVTVMYETWPAGKSPPYSPMASPLRDGVVDLQGISWAEYGGETGVWRLAKVLADAGVKATFAVNAHAIERYPDSARALHAQGHEIAGHSYTQDQLVAYMPPDQERAMIDRCGEIIQGVTGARPLGWASPRMTPTPLTAEILAERGYTWHGDYNDTDLPYVVTTPKGDIVALMHSDFTDNRVLRGSPRDFLNVYCDTFDFLRTSGQAEIINLTLHTHFGGRPMMASMFAKILSYFQQPGDVWFARHDEMAEFVLGKAKG